MTAASTTAVLVLFAAPSAALAQAEHGATVAAVAQAQIVAGATLVDGRVKRGDAAVVPGTATSPELGLTTQSEQSCDRSAPSACRIRVIDLP